MVQMKKTFPVFVLSASLVATSVSASPSAGNNNPSEEYIPVQLLGINDFHGQLDVYRTVDERQVGGAEYLAAYLEQYEQETENTLLIHVGDVVGASPPVSSLLQDEPTIEFLNEVGFDVGTVGNHEFDEGLAELKRLIDGGEHEVTGNFEGASFPYTVANVVEEATGETILPPYIIKEIDGIPIGFIGVVTTETQDIVLPSGIEGVEFTDEAEAINRATEQLKEQGVESIIVLAHVPASSDPDGANPEGEVVEFAPQIDDEVDVIYGGHNHAYANTVVDGKLIVQSYSYGTAFSDVDLLIDPETKDIVEKEASIVTTYHDEIEPDAEIKAMIDTYSNEIEGLVSEVISEAAEPITTEQDESGESPLGNLIADSQLAAVETDFTFMNPGGIRADLDEGPITWGELYTILPFGNTLVTLTLTGEQIKELLEQQWAGDSPRILQIAGLEYTWDESAPAGEKIVSIMDSDGNAVLPDQEYRVTTNNFLATGGDGFTVFQEGIEQEAGPLALDVLIEYLQAQDGSIEAPATDRIELGTATEEGGELADTATNYPVGTAAGILAMLLGGALLVIRPRKQPQ